MARDIYHNLVKEALEAEGWIITADPYRFEEEEGNKWQVDLAAEKLISAERGSEKIAVEVKTFVSPSFAHEFHSVLGQYLNYCYSMQEFDKERVLFLAVPANIYELYFQQTHIERSIQKAKVNLIIYNIDERKIEQWITHN